jgi:rod shape determining protein RodA
MDRRNLKHFDFILVGCTLAIVALSLLAIFSASRGGHEMASRLVSRQIIWAALGTVALLLISTIDHQAYQRVANRIYIVNLFLLIAVFVVGKPIKGAQRWITVGPAVIQPSEIAKIAIIISLAAFLVARRDQIREFPLVVKSFLYTVLPMLLILKEPDLGTSVVLLAIWFGMLYFAGARLRHLAAFALAGILVFGAMWHTGHVKDFQKKRLVTFINPQADPKGSAYHIRQSKIAIGSGKFLGKGYLHGTQKKLHFIPEQHTDFIFTVVGEELGFVGGAMLLLLYLCLLQRTAAIMMTAEDQMGRLISGGILSMFLFQIFVNMGMTMGIMPVAGVPLPLFSYGGSSLLTCLISIGILAGIYTRRHKINF